MSSVNRNSARKTQDSILIEETTTRVIQTIFDEQIDSRSDFS
jgi:hypothetical protein